jgi:hypothetical protein
MGVNKVNYWNIQLPTDDQDVIDLLKSGFTGIDLACQEAFDNNLKPLTEWTKQDIAQYQGGRWKKILYGFLEIKTGDIVLIRNGETPIALVKIVGNYVFSHNGLSYKHRYPIEIIDYYKTYQERNFQSHFKMPQVRGILSKVIDSNTQTYQFMDKWYKDYSRSKKLMSEHKLIEMTISNFKTFYDFKIDGLTQINLISGKNNVGKTTFLESGYINLVSNDIEHYINSFLKLSNLEFSEFQNAKNLDNISINSNINKTAVNIDNESISIEVNGISKTYPRYQMPKLREYGTTIIDRSNIQFIPSFPINDDFLSFLFSKIQIARKKDLLNKSLAENFDENIVEFDLILGEPKLFLLNREEGWVPLSEFGEGIKRFITILCAIWASQEGACFIDEIEDGIHYLHYKKLWTIIFNTAQEANCQIFASTHSKEMIESYYKEAKNLEMKDISFITLVRNKENNIKAITYDFDWFSHEMSQNHEVRGW